MFSFFWLIVLWIKETFFGFFRNIGWNLSALFLSIFCLLLFAISYVAGESADHLADQLNQRVEITVDLEKTIPKSEHDGVMERMEGISEVREITYVSEEEIYQSVKENMGEDADILEVLDENPFTARVVVKIDHPENVSKVAETIDSWGVAEHIQYGEGYVEKILTITDIASKIGFAFTAAIAFATVYIVSSAIKSNINQRRDELRIKQLTGTGMFTIRIPFVLEALLIMGISSLVVYLAFHYGYAYVVQGVTGAIPYLPMVEPAVIVDGLSTYLFYLALGIGIIGSVPSTMRNLEKI